MSSLYQIFNPEEQRTMSELVNYMSEIVKDMSKSIARMQDLWNQMIEVFNKQSNILLELKEQSKDQGSHEISENQSDVLQASPTIQESNTLEGALSIKNEFEDQRFNEVENIDQRDLFMNSNKPISIPHIEFIISDEFKGMRSKIFLFLVLIETVKELVQVSMVIIFLQHFKIRGRVFSNQCEQGLISMLQNLEDKIHLKGKGMLCPKAKWQIILK